jgi:uncharacterized protein (DUF1800 family)
VTTPERLAISRLSHRFGFGPRPGEFKRLLKLGLPKAQELLLTKPQFDISADNQPLPNIYDSGRRPPNTSDQLGNFILDKRAQFQTMLFWWLDRMVISDHGLTERMTWFWHGHWATSSTKVDDALPMFNQNQTLRVHALGNFAAMSKAMVNDGALIYWLDGQLNTAKAPNENLSRELMELFVLGVNRYSENDVRETAKALTGYKVNKTSGAVSFSPRAHHNAPITFLGATGKYDANSLSDYLVARDDCSLFITERLWYRFISSSEALTGINHQSIFKSRDLAPLVKAIGASSAITNRKYSMVKSPVDWFISVCRAFGIKPSEYSNLPQLRNGLLALGQLPFQPPNVGGWPVDQAWLSASTAQNRISFTSALLKQADLSAIADLNQSERIAALADWLGVYQWSDRTLSALAGAKKDPARLALLAVNSPEYLVNA